MPVMDEFKEEREKIKNAPLEAKWKYFCDYYLKWVIGGGFALAIVIAVIVTTLTHKDEMLYVSMPNFTALPAADVQLIEPFVQLNLENPKKQDITVDSNCHLLADPEGQSAADPDLSVRYTYEDEQKVAMVLMVGQMDMMISGEDIIDRFASGEYVRPLTDVYSVAEVKEFEDKELVRYNSSGTPVAICMDDAEKLKTYYEYTGIKVDHVYAAFTYGKHMELAKKYLDYLMN